MDFKGPTWQGRIIANPADAHDLESRAAVGEFKHRQSREDAEHRAHHEYKLDKHREAASYHLQGIKAAQASGSQEEGKKHGMFYQLHMKALGHDPMGPVPHEIKSRADKQDKFYKFKAHKGDIFLLGDRVQKSELQKALPTEQESQVNAAVHPIMEDTILEQGGKRQEVPDRNPNWAPTHFTPGIGYQNHQVPIGTCRGCGKAPTDNQYGTYGTLCTNCGQNAEAGTNTAVDLKAQSPSHVPNYAQPGHDEVVWNQLNQEMKAVKHELAKAIGRELRKAIKRPHMPSPAPANDNQPGEQAAKVNSVLQDTHSIMASDPGFQELARQKEAQSKEAQLKAGPRLFKPGQEVLHVDQSVNPMVGKVTEHEYAEHGIDGPGHYYGVKWWNPKLKQFHEDFLHQDNLQPKV